MDNSDQPKYSEKGNIYVNDFEKIDHEDSNDKAISDTETEHEEARGLKDKCTDEKQTGMQNLPASEHSSEQFIGVLNDEIKDLKKDNSELLQELELEAENRNTIKNLENQLKTMAGERKQLQRNSTELNKKIKQKDNELTEREHKVAELKQQCDKYKTKIEGLEKVQEEQTKEISRLQHLEDGDQALKNQLAQHKHTQLETVKKIEQAEIVTRQLREEIRATGEEKQHLILRVNDLTEKIKQKDSDLLGREDEIKVLEKQQATTEKQAESVIRQLREEIRAAEEEKQNLILRLSKLTGAKLTLDNPNITDLSDTKRPTKLAEEFAELYDNEWTDAFEDVNIDDECTKVSFMLQLLMRAHALCKEVSVEHLNRIKTNICKLNVCVKDHSGGRVQKQSKQEEKQAVMSVSDEENSSSCAKTMNQISPKEHSEPHGPSMVASPDTDIEQRETTETVAVEDFEIPDVVFDFNSLPHDERKTIMELRKFIEIRLSDKFEAIATDVIAREYCLDNKTKNTVLDYIRKCVNICWSMCRVDPPVSISFPDVHGDMKLDTSAYKPYTKSGRLIDFIVWPALYLHEGGPLLSKGVAQGRN